MTTPEEKVDLIELDEAAVPREAAEKVLNYLLFHRSLLGESADSSGILERYLELVQKLKEGVHVVIPDPFQKATALLFELVMEEEFDPWEIDLARFTEAFLERVKSEGSVNFAVAGRLLYMAWSILYLQSEELLRTRENPPPPPEGALGETLEVDYLDLNESAESLDVTSVVLGSPDPPPLIEMVRHPDSRPVSLLELVRAFGQAEEEARRAVRIEELRERLREEQRSPPEVIVHGDVPENDLEDAWEAALEHPIGEPFALRSLWRPLEGRDRLVALFLAALFLAREGVIELRQERLGVDPLFLVRLGDRRVPAGGP